MQRAGFSGFSVLGLCILTVPPPGARQIPGARPAGVMGVRDADRHASIRIGSRGSFPSCPVDSTVGDGPGGLLQL